MGEVLSPEWGILPFHLRSIFNNFYYTTTIYISVGGATVSKLPIYQLNLQNAATISTVSNFNSSNTASASSHK